jgi:Rps23 Pro-64 3,4-dihydroxylase Tpa1-like proline 4-hydroxylase
MFEINQIYKINNFLNEKEIDAFDHLCDDYVWELTGVTDHGQSSRIFWNKNLWNSKWGPCELIEETFKQKIESLLSIKIETDRLYLNGQAHGQCGNIHTDILEDCDPECEYMTAVYYVNKTWSPELGGFTVIIDNVDNMHVVYPQPNSIVIFNSAFSHIGLEPTIHCNGMRVTLAHKFKVLKNDN